MATAAQVNQFRQANSALVTLALRDLQAFWGALDYENGPAVRAALEDFFPDLVATYGATAALLAVDYYDELRDVAPSAARFQSVMADAVDGSTAQERARWAIGPLFGVPDPGQAFANLALVTDLLVKQAGRHTIARNAAEDPSDVFISRKPTGAETCSWCRGLAGDPVPAGRLGPDAELHKFHGNCDCTQVVSWS